MRLALAPVSLTPRRTFRISRGAKTTVANLLVRISSDGIAGYGEASPNAFYGETVGDTAAKLEGIREPLREMAGPASPEHIAQIWHTFWPGLAPSRAAQCALDLALWDWLGRAQQKSVFELATGRPPRPITTFCTIGLCGPEELDARLKEVHGFPRLKVKSDHRADFGFIRTIAGRSQAELSIDANCAWAPEQVLALSREAAELPILFLEQPLPPERDSEMPALLMQSELPILADESCVTREDVAQIPGRFHGFNIKLVKCGGLTPALAMQEEGRRLGLRIMTGCMLETSLLIAAGCVVAAGCDFADLDGAWLLANDPCAGLRFDRGVLNPFPAPGFGVTPQPQLFPAV